MISDEALRLLWAADERLKELAAMDPDDPYDWAPLRKRLQQTRDVITTCLPE